MQPAGHEGEGAHQTRKEPGGVPFDTQMTESGGVSGGSRGSALWNAKPPPLSFPLWISLQEFGLLNAPHLPSSGG